ncbi:hypothetical protein NX773_17965 [Massilia solisilvae]|uniref:Uncharacterized protein n=1 Tax=Massilia solisilvae TaxID=1811225 RepID=A0ABT2BNK8_9BURK|nr:hypothetical protein [Massilia solisilvae]MCS0610057.1 hypothetical protein [Massilia solisilvae]
MKEIKQIEGFKVEVLESVRSGKVWFTVRFMDYSSAKAEASSLPDAVAELGKQWEDIKAAYREAGLKPPKPPRSRGNQRTLKTIRWLASRPPLSPDVL